MLTPSRKAVWSLLGAFAVAAGVLAASAPQNDAAGQTIDRAIAAELTARGGVGASVAAISDGRQLLAKGYGHSAVGGAPVGDDTLFGIGSVTKQFTSAAALLLAEDGKLSVNDKVSKYYPGLTRANDITLLDLMNHVSGYPDFYPLDFVDRRMLKPIAPDELIKQYAGGALDFDPGTRWSYSNTGYVLLGRILEKVSGQPLGEFLRTRIFDPVGMRHTLYEPDPNEKRVASGYTSFMLTKLTPSLREGPGWVGPAGAIYSTAADVARWDLALMGGRILRSESWQLMSKPRQLTTGVSSGYGCGLGVGLRDGVTVFTHGGAVSGFIARNTFMPQTSSAVVVLVNDEDGPLANAIVEKALDAVMPKRPGNMPVTTGPSASRAAIPKVAGPAPADEVKTLFGQFQRGSLDRGGLGDEYSFYATDRKVKAAAQKLKPYGQPTAVDVRNVGERGGMEVATVRLAFGARGLDALMYRSPDGKIQEFLLFRP